MPTPPLYISVAQVRAVGVPTPPDDGAVTAAIGLAQALVERATRLWFYSRAIIFSWDGTDSDSLHFPVPIISIDELRINGSDVALDPSFYRVYNGIDSRENPRIALSDARSGDLDIFTAPMNNGQMLFRKGKQNQYIAGNFGYVEADGSVPLPIQRAVLLLTVEKLTKPVYIDASSTLSPPSSIVGTIIEEGTDGHYVKYAQAGGGTTKARRVSAFAGLTDNPEVLTILKMYRAPIFIAAPASRSYLR